MKTIYKLIIGLLLLNIVSCDRIEKYLEPPKVLSIVFYESTTSLDHLKIQKYLKTAVERFDAGFYGSKLCIIKIPNKSGEYLEPIIFEIQDRDAKTEYLKQEVLHKIDSIQFTESGYCDIFTALDKANLSLKNDTSYNSIQLCFISNMLQKDEVYSFSQCYKYRPFEYMSKHNLDDADSLLKNGKLNNCMFDLKKCMIDIKILDEISKICPSNFNLVNKLSNFWEEYFKGSKVNWNLY